MFLEFLDTASETSPMQTIMVLGIWAVVLVAAYFMFIRPQRKKQQQEEELRNSIEIGDDVTTIGGIVGRVIAVREDDETIVIETGSDKTRMRFKKWAISSVDTPDKQPKTETKKSDDGDKKKKKPTKSEE